MRGFLHLKKPGQLKARTKAQHFNKESELNFKTLFTFIDLKWPNCGKVWKLGEKS